jgi:hypothetical protein
VGLDTIAGGIDTDPFDQKIPSGSVDGDPFGLDTIARVIDADPFGSDAPAKGIDTSSARPYIPSRSIDKPVNQFARKKKGDFKEIKPLYFDGLIHHPCFPNC